MNVKNLKIELPKNWKETSRMGTENQIIIHIYHINPLALVDPKNLEDHPMPSSNPNVSISKVSVPTPNIRPLNDFYKGMKGAIASGFMPKEYTQQKLDELWSGMTKTKNAERPGESDLASDIEVIQFQDEEVAWQALKNRGMMPTQGFDVPLPGGVTMPGMPKNMTMADILQGDMLKKFIPKEQLGGLKKMQDAIKEVQQKMPKIKQDLEKEGTRYREGKIFDCKAIFLDSPNHNSPPSTKPATSSRKKVSGMGMGGGINIGGSGGYSGIPPLPKMSPKPYSAINTMCMGFLYKNFIIGGPLLWAINNLPLGDTPCYSLTQTKEVKTINKEGGVTLTSISIVPLPSNYAQEGYLHKEEVEKIYKNIILKLNNN